MKTMYKVEDKKENTSIIIKPHKGRVQLKTVRSAQYSFKDKAERKRLKKLKEKLKRLDFDSDL